MWSFVGNKRNKQWIWLALNRDTREIVGLYVGNRGIEGAQGLWMSLPDAYQQFSMAYTDFWESYQSVFKPEQLKQSNKKSGATSHIERFNNTLRQRISRLARKTLSFSKKLENHIASIWMFVHHYNKTLNA